MGQNPTQDYWTASRVKARLSWRPGKLTKRSVCEGFCALFGTADCPLLKKKPPKEGHCETFRVNAEEPNQVEVLIAADRRKYLPPTGRRLFETFETPLRPADEHVA